MIRAPRRSTPRSSLFVGLSAVGIAIVVMTAAFLRADIATWLRSGETVQAEFARDYQLVPKSSEVKMAGVVVGTVTEVEKGQGGKAVVSMKIDEGIRERLGSAPSAMIRPKTLLGGSYYVHLEEGGRVERFDGEVIPLKRTNIPVELDRILAAIPPPAQEGIQAATRQLDATLSQGGSEAVKELLHDLPGTLRPAAPILRSALGKEPESDIPRLVSDLHTFASAATKNEGQMGDIVDSLHDITTALSAEKQPLAATIATLPQTLRTTRSGLKAVHGTLGKLATTAGNARPAIRELNPLLAKTDLALEQARPVVSDLKPLLRQARPLVNRLVPTADRATATLDNLRGPVIDRINGPIAKTVLSPWSGTGPYAGNGGNGHLFYEQVGYLAAHGANVSQYGDHNGAMIGLALGAGVSTVGGSGQTLAKLLASVGAMPLGYTPLPESAGEAPDRKEQPNRQDRSPAKAEQPDSVSGLLPPVLPDDGNGR